MFAIDTEVLDDAQAITSMSLFLVVWAFAFCEKSNEYNPSVHVYLHLYVVPFS